MPDHPKGLYGRDLLAATTPHQQAPPVPVTPEGRRAIHDEAMFRQARRAAAVAHGGKAMSGPAITLDEVAAELGRSEDWLRKNYIGLVQRGRLPKPLHECGGLVWSRAQVWAHLDRELPDELKSVAAAYRAAAAAATRTIITGPDDLRIEIDSEFLRNRFEKVT